MNKSERKILVVDDEQHICSILSRILGNAGYQVITASDGKKALQLTKDKEPDLILLDLMMPGINGREVCHIVREFSPEIRIVYFTAKVESDPLLLKELRGEADAFITKPATSKQILSKINSLLDDDR